jgi:phosphoribosyl 1,2-cyclic phosphodiesterase
MAFRFTVLASGSAGNASLLQADGFGLLVDAGLGPRQLAGRLAAAGLSWADVHALVLTHTHSDHWHDRTLAHLHRRRLPLWCHAEHHAVLMRYAPSFPALHGDGLARTYEPGGELVPAPGLRCRPLPVRHDSGATFAFRFEGKPDLFGQAVSLGYAADLGCWDEPLAEGMADVDVLAVEFNHDVAMQYASGRPARLIARVLGDHGHLSNEQAADFVREVLRRSTPGRLQHLVQLHLSRECNRPELAQVAARAVVRDLAAPVEVHTASQDEPGRTLHLGGAGFGRVRTPPRAARRPRQPRPVHPVLPGFEAFAG